MMEDRQKSTTEDAFISIVTALKAVEDANKWIMWRDVFGYYHPSHNPKEIDNLERWQYANFCAAKHVYCHFKEDIDRYCKENYTHGFCRQHDVYQFELLSALRHLLEREMNDQLESQILINEELQGYWEGDEYLPLPDSNIELDLNSY